MTDPVPESQYLGVMRSRDVLQELSKMAVPEAQKPYLIWSHEHSAWWAMGGGYSRKICEARHFTHSAAMDICLKAMPGTVDRLGALPELPVCLFDVLALACGYTETYPNAPREEWA